MKQVICVKGRRRAQRRPEGAVVGAEDDYVGLVGAEDPWVWVGRARRLLRLRFAL